MMMPMRLTMLMMMMVMSDDVVVDDDDDHDQGMGGDRCPLYERRESGEAEGGAGGAG